MSSPEIGDIIKNITDDVKTIVAGEMALAKAELAESGKKAGAGAGMFGGAGYLGLNAISLLFMAGGFGIGELFSWGLGWSLLGSAAIGYVIMTVILLVLAVILTLIGKGKLEGIKGPERTVAEGKATAENVKAAITRGKENVKAEALERAASKDHKDLEPVQARNAWPTTAPSNGTSLGAHPVDKP